MSNYANLNANSRQSGETFASDPDATADCSVGWTIGAFWFNSTTNQLWRCINAAPGAASWIPINPVGQNQVVAPLGTSGSPGFAFTGTSYGFFNAGSLIQCTTALQVNNNFSMIAGMLVATIVLTTGNYILTKSNNIIIVNKTVGAATTITLPTIATAPKGVILTIKDGKGDAATNNITVSGDVNIDGAASYVINTAYGVLRLVSNGTTWSAI